ncbi:hypothetical protein GALL_408660 [mine drainage metagenome]|uniref:Uncharacterized protein n=1 Tax=mine drainage metagenome TaxID=410659 RepID=A0A1J5QIV8_9ZZZZ
MQRGIVDDREVRRRAGEMLDVALPLPMLFDIVDRYAHHLGVALGELGGELGDGTELGRANRGEVLRVGEQDGIAVADPLVQLDLTGSGIGGEIGGGVVDAN